MPVLRYKKEEFSSFDPINVPTIFITLKNFKNTIFFSQWNSFGKRLNRAIDGNQIEKHSDIVI